MLAAWSSGGGEPTHRFTFEFEPACIVNEAVQDRVGVGRIVYGLMPAGHRKLAGDKRGALTVAVLEDFETMTGVAVEWLKTPIVQDQ